MLVKFKSLSPWSQYDCDTLIPIVLVKNFLPDFGTAQSHQCAYYHSVPMYILNPIFINSTTDYMHGNCDSNCWLMCSKRFVTVCAGYYQFETVCDSLRQFVTAGASQTVCDCHIANSGCGNWEVRIVQSRTNFTTQMIKWFWRYLKQPVTNQFGVQES